MGLGTAAIAGLGIATAATQAGAGNLQAKNLKKAGEFNAQVYEQQSSMILEQKKLEEYQYNRAAAKTRGAIVSRTAGAGFQFSGSPVAIAIDSEIQIQFDKAIADYNSTIQSNYAKSGAIYMRNTATQQANLAEFTGYSNAFSSLLGTASSIGKLSLPTRARTP
jgi:hypothetical protein